MMRIDKSLPVLCADELPLCDGCGEPWCTVCGCHYFECAHPGPATEDDDGEAYPRQSDETRARAARPGPPASTGRARRSRSRKS